MTLKRLRVDNVGSMLRPAALREAFVKYADGGLSEEQLTHEQDEAIRAVIAHQERIGFPIVVDGEFRRTGYLASFADIEGAEDWLSRWTPRRLHREQPVTAGPARGADPVHSDDLRTPATTKLRLKRNRPLEEYSFAAKQTATPAKITIIGPDRVSTLHHLGHPDDVYGDAEEFMADVVKVEREMIGQIVDAGCKYVHIDEPGFTAYADEASLEVLRSRGDDPEVNCGDAATGVEAIREISFDVREREFVCIVGPSGGGKTTLLRALCGLHPKSGGSIQLHGREVVEPPAEMAAVFQDYSRSLMPWFTVERNVELPLKNTIKDKGDRAQRVEWALHEVGLDGFGDRYPWQLSGGMQQRVAIARAIAYQPQILIMDEPFASVDAQTRSGLEDLILSIRHDVGTAVLLVTHDIDEAVYLADRVVVLSSRPATVMDVVEVDLPRPRDQLETKSMPRFAEYRTHVLELIRATSQPDVPSAG